MAGRPSWDAGFATSQWRQLKVAWDERQVWQPKIVSSDPICTIEPVAPNIRFCSGRSMPNPSSQYGSAAMPIRGQSAGALYQQPEMRAVVESPFAVDPFTGNEWSGKQGAGNKRSRAHQIWQSHIERTQRRHSEGTAKGHSTF